MKFTFIHCTTLSDIHEFKYQVPRVYRGRNNILGLIRNQIELLGRYRAGSVNRYVCTWTWVCVCLCVCKSSLCAWHRSDCCVPRRCWNGTGSKSSIKTYSELQLSSLDADVDSDADGAPGKPSPNVERTIVLQKRKAGLSLGTSLQSRSSKCSLALWPRSALSLFARSTLSRTINCTIPCSRVSVLYMHIMCLRMLALRAQFYIYKYVCEYSACCNNVRYRDCHENRRKLLPLKIYCFSPLTQMYLPEPATINKTV